MFRVKWFDEGMNGKECPAGWPRCFDYTGHSTPPLVGVDPEKQDRTMRAVAAMVKRDKLTLSHTDEEGFTCYLTPAEAEAAGLKAPKSVNRLAKKARVCPHCGGGL